jgi:hypothetical protein
MSFQDTVMQWYVIEAQPGIGMPYLLGVPGGKVLLCADDYLASVSDTVRLPVACRECGDIYPDGAQFCIRCGVQR